MNLNALVEDPTKLKTYGKYISIDDAYKRVKAGDKSPRLLEIVASDPKMAYQYARDIIKGRWPEREKVIASDPWSAYTYARYVIEGRFPQGEPAIASDPKCAELYKHFVSQGETK